MTTSPLQAANLSYLASAPQACGQTPSQTRPQLLELRSLQPKDFERLCYRLTRLQGTVEACRIFGIQGQAQGGIDLYARKHDGTYMVIQCKRTTDTFTPAEITTAVNVFLSGEWTATATEFVLAVTDNLERTQTSTRLEQERSRLAERGITLTVWDEAELSAQLKDQSRIVDDFFGREAVRVFNGEQAAAELGSRLDAAAMIEYRKRLGSLYRTVFGRFERGVHGTERTVALDERFVVPDIVIGDHGDGMRHAAHAAAAHIASLDIAATTDWTMTTLPAVSSAALSRRSHVVPDVLAGLRDPMAVAAPVRAFSALHTNRVAVTDWLATGSRHVVIGSPGAGKSALLRMLVLDLFSDDPSLTAGLDRLHAVLPVWLPFAFWTSAARRNNRAVSVLDAVREWLSAYDHEDLWPLIDAALRDDRVLLVVDGLDEWATPDTARLCIDRLEVFAATKNAGVLASSRPFSAAELPLDSEGWRTATLAALDSGQRHAFITKWLAPLLEQPALDRDASAWAAEIESSPHLRELADLPLFLTLLLRSKEQSTEFPHDLRAVLDDVVHRMVGEHRRRKIDTSGAADPFPSTGDIRRVSAATAEQMHRDAAISISDDDLRTSFRTTLLHEIGLPLADAHTTAQTLVNALSPGVGLMIRPAPDETQFFHRSVLEFLTAERLLTLSSEQIVALAADHLTDRRWTQVVRFLLRGITRPREIVEVFNRLDDCSATNPLLREATDLLAAEVAVSASATDAATRRRLLHRVIDVIETGEREPHRAALLDRLVTGLSRREVRGELAVRFRRWLRGSSRENQVSALRAASRWPADDLLHDVLWQALHTDEPDIERLAGQILGTTFTGDTTTAHRLADLARTTRLPGRRAAATEALSRCDPAHPDLAELIVTGRDHLDYAVRHASITADLRRGHTTEANRDALVTVLDEAPEYGDWAASAIDLLIEHFPDDQLIFEQYLQRAERELDPERHQPRALPATHLLLKGYTDRPQTRQLFTRMIAADRSVYPSNPNMLLEYVPWPQVIQAYRDNPDLTAPVEQLVIELLNSRTGERGAYLCSQVIQTRRIRDRLLACLQPDTRWGLGWIVRALHEGWPDDPDAQHALRALLAPADDTLPDSVIALVPDILPDPQAALTYLTALPATNSTTVDALTRALAALTRRGLDPADPRAKHLLNKILTHHTATARPATEAALFAAFMHDTRVRDRAKARLQAHGVSLASIVQGVRDDTGMRATVAEHLRCLPTPLRARLAEALANTPMSDAAATELLAEYDCEPDATVKLLAATAYARRLAHTQSVTDEVVHRFTEQARAVGPELDERRGAAFCALAELGRLDVLTDLREHHTGEPARIRHGYSSDTHLFYRYVCRYWTDISTALGADFSRRFGYDNTSDHEFFQDLFAVAHDYPDTRADLLAMLDRRPELAASAEAAQYLQRVAAVPPDEWASFAITVLDHADEPSFLRMEEAWTALHVLTEQFATLPLTEHWLDRRLASITSDSGDSADGHRNLSLGYGVVAAIARLRPNHSLLPALREHSARPADGALWYTFPEWTELSAATTPTAAQLIDLARDIADVVTRNDQFAGYIHRPLAARLRRDDRLAAELTDLLPLLEDGAAGIAIRLLWLSGQLNDAATRHVQQIAHGGKRSSSWTVDPLTGRTRHCQLLALDILDTTTS